MRLEEEQLESRRRRLLDMTEAARGGQHVGTEMHRRKIMQLPYSCGGVTFSKDRSNFLVRSDNGAGSVDCGLELNFRESGIAGLGYRVFAGMQGLERL